MRLWIMIFSLLLLVSGCAAREDDKNVGLKDLSKGAVFYLDKEFKERAGFFRKAFRTTKIHVCTIDRANAEARKEAALKNYPKKEGYDRIGWPLYVCKEGGAGSYVEYIKSEKNQAVENWIQEQLSKYPDGTRLIFRVGNKLEIKRMTEQKDDPSQALHGERGWSFLWVKAVYIWFSQKMFRS